LVATGSTVGREPAGAAVRAGEGESAGATGGTVKGDEDPPAVDALAAGAPAEGDVVVEAPPVEAPASRTLVPPVHAVRESAARTTVAAAPTRRVRGFRMLDM
jgi:hypothetical protein